MAINLCSIDGCRKHAANGRGWCWAHYTRWRRHGHPEAVSRFRGRTSSERFYDHVDRSDACWVWTGAQDRDGYGSFQDGGRSHRAHRWIYAQMHGEIMPGLVVRHTCDNPPCVNLDHLLIGSPADNTQDMLDRGRSLAGSRNPASKLTEGQVADIKCRLAKGETYGVLASDYEVVPEAIGHIAKGRAWRHVSERGWTSSR